MDFDQQEREESGTLRDEQEDDIPTDPPPKQQYSLRALFLLAVPFAILALTHRWLVEGGNSTGLFVTFCSGAALGGVLGLMFGLLSASDYKKDGAAYYLDWMKYCLLAALYTGSAMVFVAVVRVWLLQWLNIEHI